MINLRTYFCLSVLVTACSLETTNLGTPVNDSRETMFVRQALTTRPPDCIFSPDSTDVGAWRPAIVDVGVRDNYFAVLLVDGAVRGTSIDGAHVVVRDGDEVLSDRIVAASGFAGQDARAVVGIEAIDATTAATLLERLPLRESRRALDVSVEVIGTLISGGDRVKTPIFRLPVAACDGCLVTFEDANDPSATLQPNCMRAVEPAPRTACFPGQDAPVPCQLCQARRACDPTYVGHGGQHGTSVAAGGSASGGP